MLRDEYGEEVPLPQNQSLYCLQQILDGVNYIHQSGYLHLDINSNFVFMYFWCNHGSRVDTHTMDMITAGYKN